MRRPPVKITPPDLCAVDVLARDRTFTFGEFVDQRSPWLSKDAARNVLRRMQRNGDIAVVKRGSYRPTEQGWKKIRAACAIKRG